MPKDLVRLKEACADSGEGRPGVGLRLDTWSRVRTFHIAHRWDAQVYAQRGSNAGLKTNPFASMCQWVNRYRHTAEQVREWPLCCLTPRAFLSVLKIKGALSLASAIRAEFLESAREKWKGLRGADGSPEWPSGSERGCLPQLQGSTPHPPRGVGGGAGAEALSELFKVPSKPEWNF